MYDFSTNEYRFRRLEFPEVKQLEAGDEIAICIHLDIPNKAEFVKATVIRPLFWNADADEPGWELETTKGFADAYSIYEVKEGAVCN